VATSPTGTTNSPMCGINTNMHSKMFPSSGAGLPDYSWSKHTKTGKNIANDHKLFQTAIKYTKWPKIFQMVKNKTTFYISRPSKIYPDLNFLVLK
jgi:hypothetical protein